MRPLGVLDRASGELGSHICSSFDDRTDFCAAAIEFLAEGHDRGERLLYVADGPRGEMRRQLQALDADRLLAEGSLLLREVRDLYEPGGVFDAVAQVAAYRELVEAAVVDGYRGLRVAADATALVAAPMMRRAFIDYELCVDRFIANAPMAAMCAYDAAVLGPGLEDLLAVHPASHGADREATCRVFYEDEVLRLAGEFDLTAWPAVDTVLRALVTSDDPAPTIDLSDLEFIDVRTVVRLSQAATSLARRGRRLRAIHAPPMVARMVDILDLDGLASALEVS